MTNAVTTHRTKILVLGGGPGGYTAAFRAADLGEDVSLVERFSVLGGVCANVGCIPSKTLLHAAKVMEEVESLASYGIEFSAPKLKLDKLRTYKEGVIKKLNGGLEALAKRRKVKRFTGYGEFINDKTVSVITKDEAGKITSEARIEFEKAIIAAGSEPIRLPFLPDDPRIMSSTGALALQDIPKELLIVGGGIIGLEMATVYGALGSNITVVEMGDMILPGTDVDLIKPLFTHLNKKHKLLLKTKLTQVEAKSNGLLASFEGENAPNKAQCFDRILVAIGRIPNGKLIGTEKAGITVDTRGFIPVNAQLQTNVPHIFAIGDIVGNPMLAHKASAEARVAAEVIAGKPHVFDPKCIPSVAYTDPEIAWVGLTEVEAKAKGVAVKTGVFPWIASGRAMSQGRTEGRTKLIFDPNTHKVLGGGIVGPNAGELIGEIALAIEMGCDAEDIALTIHPHPTLSESIMMAAEVFEGTVTDL